MRVNTNKLINGLKFISIEVKKIVRNLAGMPIIEVIGDSHSLLFQNERFNINYIGPATAYNLGAEGSSNESKNKILHILNKKAVKKKCFLLVFGEIDARIHIYKTTQEKNVTTTQAITQTVKRYGEFVRNLQLKYPECIFMILNILPQGEQGNFYNYKYYATRDIRVEITVELNRILKEFCLENNIPFIEVFRELIEKDSQRKKNLVFDEIHYTNKIVPYIIPQINKTLLQYGTEI